MRRLSCYRDGRLESYLRFLLLSPSEAQEAGVMLTTEHAWP